MEKYQMLSMNQWYRCFKGVTIVYYHFYIAILLSLIRVIQMGVLKLSMFLISSYNVLVRNGI